MHLRPRDKVAGALMAMCQGARATGREMHLAAGAGLGYLLVDVRIVDFWPITR
jgi:hypothetical protein